MTRVVEDQPFGVLWNQPAVPTRGRRRGPSGEPVSRALILDTALRLADEGGLEAVSMRLVAAELGVGAMTLYHHVPTKDALLDLMYDHILGELAIPAAERAEHWLDAVAQISRATYAMYVRHPWAIADASRRPQYGPRAFDQVEQSLAAISGLGLSAKDLARVLAIADDHVVGFVVRRSAEEAALARFGGESADQHAGFAAHLRRAVTDGDRPHLAAFLESDWSLDDAAAFEVGLQVVLSGLAAYVAERQVEQSA
jgi:AcrR family transcriptional regulator